MGTYNIKDYYLDIKSIIDLPPSIQEMLSANYNTLLHNDIGEKARESIFNTLIKSGYLKSLVQEERDDKIETILS